MNNLTNLNNLRKTELESLRFVKSTDKIVVSYTYKKDLTNWYFWFMCKQYLSFLSDSLSGYFYVSIKEHKSDQELSNVVTKFEIWKVWQICIFKMHTPSFPKNRRIPPPYLKIKFGRGGRQENIISKESFPLLINIQVCSTIIRQKFEMS